MEPADLNEVTSHAILSTLKYTCCMKLAFPTERQATICKECMEVDDELTDKSAKIFRVHGNQLEVYVELVNLNIIIVFIY